MAFWNDYSNAGIWPMQDHSERQERKPENIPTRIVRHAGRTIDVDKEFHLIPDSKRRGGDDSYGDILGGQLWTTIRTARPISAWAFVWPAIGAEENGEEFGFGKEIPEPVETGGAPNCVEVASPFRVLPITFDDKGNQEMEPDKRFNSLRPVLPIENGRRVWPLFPRKYYGLTVTAVNEWKQIETFHPTDPRLIAVNVNGDARTATIVCDENDKAEIDADRCARLHTFFRVIKKPQGCVGFNGLNSLGWNIKPAGCDRGGWGFFIDRGGNRMGGGGPEIQTGASVGTRTDTGPRSTAPVGEQGLSVGSVGQGIAQATLTGYGMQMFGTSPGVGLISGINLPNQGGPGRTVVDDAGQGDPGQTQTNGGPGCTIGMASSHESGIVHVPAGETKHIIGQDEDGNKIIASHLSTNVYFWASPSRDGPLSFGGRFKEVEECEKSVETTLEWDPAPIHRFVCGPRRGKWRWRTKVPPFWRIPPEDDPDCDPIVPPPEKDPEDDKDGKKENGDCDEGGCEFPLPEPQGIHLSGPTGYGGGVPDGGFGQMPIEDGFLGAMVQGIALNSIGIEESGLGQTLGGGGGFDKKTGVMPLTPAERRRLGIPDDTNGPGTPPDPSGGTKPGSTQFEDGGDSNPDGGSKGAGTRSKGGGDGTTKKGPGGTGDDSTGGDDGGGGGKGRPITGDG